jgi:hypothetical protein
MNSLITDNNKIDYIQLLREYEGREVPDDMHPWFCLAHKMREFQLSKQEKQNRIDELEAQKRIYMEDIERVDRLEKEYMKTMDVMTKKWSDNDGI